MSIKALPDCDLIDILKDKVKFRRDIDFNFLGVLDEFRQRVSGEVRKINELFPEYTPHDEEYHLKRLFHVADTVLGKDRLESMNSVELFVLALSLYGHDWGMAVSNSEKEYIINPEISKETKPEDIWIFPDEHIRFNNFARDNQLTKDSDGHFAEIPRVLWAEYVRKTHAFRSAERIRRYFQPIDGGVAEAASRVCEGHWLDFEDLQNYQLYPIDFSVLRETINIRALSVYLRLIDLLDLAEDRTPYIIWKFVAPRNPISKMEWAKHRSLRPVTCPKYQEGRIIRVDGSTDDHEVYAALEDLRIWCQEQLKGCNDTLSLMNDPRHKLDIYHIDWRVAARGFEPISVQFEFNRKRMFEILGDEIYQNDPYVFLRELLQNSIDAIRMRREVLARNGISSDKLGIIRVEVQHGENGDAVVSWSDDGIGMNEYVMRNYLAVAGNSYYRSADFEREGLKMDPISKFGIGILSCFMVADRLEIETFREPYMPPTEQPLRIAIPSMQRQFRIEKGSEEGAKVGTSIRVFIDGNKIPKDANENQVQQLNVTKYLCYVAGFVEFPILVTEGDKKTIILHPKHDSEAALQRFGEDEDIEVQKLDLGYSWHQIFLPQDLKIAHELLKEQTWDICSNLNLEGYDGTITYPVASSFEQDFVQDYAGGLTEQGARALIRENNVGKTPLLRWRRDSDLVYAHLRYESELGISRSSSFSPIYAVYRDGILISSASQPEMVKKRLYRSSDWLLPRIVVNIPKSIAPKVDLARKEILEEKQSWDIPIYQAHIKNISKLLLKDLLNKKSHERFYRLGYISVYHNIEVDDLWEVFPHKKWPMPFLDKGGGLRVLDWEEILADKIYLAPDILKEELRDLFYCQFSTNEEYSGPLSKWSGEKCLIHKIGFGRLSYAVARAAELWQLPLRDVYYFDGIRFLRPPWKNNPPIFQKILRKEEVPSKLLDDNKILERAIIDPSKLNCAERAFLYKNFFYYHLGFNFPEFVNFPKPFEKAFGYGLDLLNLRHLATQALIKVVAALEMSKRQKTLSKERLGNLSDILRAIFEHYGGYDLEQFCMNIKRLWVMVSDSKLVDIENIDKLIPSHEDFVTGTAISVEKEHWVIRTPDKETLSDKIDFGKAFE